MPTEISRSGAAAGGGTGLEEFLSTTHLGRVAGRGEAPKGPSASAASGAVLFVDISGFTGLTERFAARGARGAEELSDTLNRYFGRLAEGIEAAGGDVVAFAGDAVIALWLAAEDGSPESAVRAAARCALSLRADLDSFAVDGEELDLSARATLSAGPLRLCEVGGHGGRWLFVVSGPALARISALDRAGSAGEILIETEAASSLREVAVTREVLGGAQLLSLDDSGMEGTERLARPRVGVETLRALVPEVVAERLAAGQGGFLADFRTVSVVFVQLSLPAGADDSQLEDLHRAVVSLQEIVERFEGELYQCLCDDKGTVVVAAFGMPPHSHEDDAARACLFALDAESAGSTGGRESAIGIASGRLFCGAYGSSTRRQYSLVGPAMNLAARLMQAAGERSAILVEPATARAAARRVHFESRGKLRLKGLAEAVEVLSPGEPGSPRGPGSPRALAAPSPSREMAERRMVGRREEMAVLEERLEDLQHLEGAGAPGLVVVEAEAGMGKTTLVLELAARARVAGLAVALGGADSMETDTPYYALRPIFRHLLRIGPGDGVDEILERASALVAGDPELEIRLPLLRSVVPLDFPDNALTAQMSGRVQADNTHRLLLALVAAVLGDDPLLLILEDGHWMDTATWALALGIRRSGLRVWQVITTRPSDDPPEELRRLLELPSTRRLELGSLDRTELADLLSRRFQVASLPDAVCELIWERSEGNPFYAEELAFSIRDRGVLQIDGGECRLADAALLESIELPDTLQGLITGRTDALPVRAQLALKAASVIGRVFELEMLERIYPVAEDVAVVAAQMDALVAADLVHLERGGERPAYVFHHAVTQESVYQLLPFAQRRSLHRAAAAYLEEAHPHDKSPVYARLAHHFSEAEMAEEAMVALRFAGEQAIDAYANRESVRLLERAVALDARHPGGMGAAARARVHHLLAHAHYGLSHYPEIESATAVALAATGRRLPLGGVGLAREIGRLWTHELREKLGLRVRPFEGEARQMRIDAIFALAELLPSLMFQGRRVHALHAALQIFNMSRRVADSPIPSSARTGYGMAVGALGLRRRGEAHLRRAAVECAAHGELEFLISSHNTLGQFMIGVGRVEPALPWLAEAEARADELGTGLWRHRSKLMLGEARFLLGRFDAAAQSYADAAAVAIEAEPAVYGLNLSLEGLARLRRGELEAAFELLKAGVAGSRSHPAPLPLFSSLGGLAEVHLRCGRPGEALEVALVAEAIAVRSPGEVSSFITGMHGLSSICQVYLERLESGGSLADHPDAGDLPARAARMCKALGRFALLYPTARPRYELMEGWRQQLRGRDRAALRRWRRCRRLAETTKQPFDMGLASYRIGLLGAGEQRRRTLEEAATALQGLGAAHELSLVHRALADGRG